MQGKLIFLICLFLICFNGWCFSQTITLAWDASLSSDVESYNLYWGTLSRIYDDFKSTNELQVQVSGLEQQTTYYFAVTAVDSSGNESDYSEEISYILPPTGINENKTVRFGSYPNPFINEIKFDGYEKIEIFNARGQLIETILTGKWNASGYANGAYFCKGYVRKDDILFKGFGITKIE